MQNAVKTKKKSMYGAILLQKVDKNSGLAE